MSEAVGGGDDLDDLAESFVMRFRRGERPTLAEYAARRPELASQIHALFPTLVGMEELKRSAESSVRESFAHESHFGVPERLGDYKVERLIGTGGMGVVYEAERESLQARVALKVLHPRFRDAPGYRARFRNEARSAARLHHNNIVPVFDFGEHEGHLFYAMQYIPGVGLDRVLDDIRRLRDESPPSHPRPESGLAATIADGMRTGHYPDLFFMAEASNPIPPPSSEISVLLSRFSSMRGRGQVRYHREVARLGAEVAEALAHAHERGVLHRDVKPSNILLDARGTAWVTDFGLAKYDGGENLTEVGDVVGTLRYMAPERFDGASDARCDIYALGTTLYEMIALRPAFPETNRSRLLRSILEETPPRLRKFDRQVSRDLETVIFKAIARRPGDRYGTAAELAAELRRVEANRPIRARRIPPHEQYWRWCRRNPLLSGSTALAAVLTVVVAIVSTTAAVWLRHLNEVARASERLRSEQLWSADLAEARAWQASGKPGQRFEALRTIRKAVALGRELGYPRERFDLLRREAIAALTVPDIHVTDTIDAAVPGNILDAELDHGLYVDRDRQGRHALRRQSDHSVVARFPETPGIASVEFGPWPWLAQATSENGFVLWDLTAPAPVARVRAGPPVAGWSIAADGRRLAIARHDGSVMIHDLPTGELRGTLPPGLSRRVPRLGLHPTAPYLAVVSYFTHRQFEVRHTGTGRTRRVDFPWENDGAYTPAWRRDGRRLAIARGGGQELALYDFDPESGATRLAVHARDDGIQGGSKLTFNGPGDRLFGLGWSQQLTMFDAESGRPLLATPPFLTPMFGQPRLDGAGKRLLPGTVSEDFRGFGFWSVAEGRESRELTIREPDGPFGLVTLLRGGRLAVASASDGLLAFFDLELGRQVGSVRLPTGPHASRVVADGAGRLVIASYQGAYRWPVRPDPLDADGLVFGPPERLPLAPGTGRIATDPQGRVIAQAMEDRFGMEYVRGGWVYREGDRHASRFRPDIGSDQVSVSPDGRWVSLSFNESLTEVRDAASGEVVWRTPREHRGAVFSPCGRYLAISRLADPTLSFGSPSRTYLHETGNWGVSHLLGDGSILGFSGDGEFAILTGMTGTLRLVHVPSRRELAWFERYKSAAIASGVVLTPDATKLVLTASRGIVVVDLRAIRAGLSEIGLDWEAPPFPASRAVPDLRPLRVRFVGAALVDPRFREVLDVVTGLFGPFVGRTPRSESLLRCGVALARLGLDGAAGWPLDAALRLDPGLDDARLERAFVRYRLGDREGAERDFRRVDTSHPEDGDRLVGHAWVRHELGRDDEALVDLRRAVALKGGRTPSVPAMLALAAQILTSTGRHDEAAATLKEANSRTNDLAASLGAEAFRFLTEPRERRLDRLGLALGEEAARLDPSSRPIRRSLALALYRAGDWARARTILRDAIAQGKEAFDCLDLTILAMCHHRLGETAEARAALEQGRLRRPSASNIEPWQEIWVCRLESEAHRLISSAR